MKWSWKVAEFAGIGVYIHATFLLVIVWVAALHWNQGAASILEGVLFVLALFGCVVLHEFGHALAAKRYGIRTRDITLLPIGGLARLERMPDDPKQELVVAIAGPAVNVVIAALLYAAIVVLGRVDLPARWERFEPFYLGAGSFLYNLMIVNIFLVIFNLIPAFPMDGGRVLRGLLATRMDYVRATNIAAGIGQFMAFLFGLAGLTGLFGLMDPNPFLVFIAFFVYIGAAQEAGMVQMKAALSGIPIQRAMLTQFHTLSPNDPLQRAIDLTLGGSQRDFPVVDDGRLVGLLSQDDLMRALQQSSASDIVAKVMRREYQHCEPGEMLESVFLRIQEDGAHTVPVVRDGELVGLLTMENIGEMLRIGAALDKQRGHDRYTQLIVDLPAKLIGQRVIAGLRPKRVVHREPIQATIPLEVRAMILSTAPPPLPLQLDQHGIARVGGTRVTLDSVIAVFKQGATPEEIAESFPTLRLADIYSVLGYYLQRRADVDAYLEKRREESDAIRAEAERRFNLIGLRERLLARRQSKDAAS